MSQCLLVVGTYTLVHTSHTYTHSHSYIYTYTQAHSDPYTHTRTHIHTGTLTPIHTYINTQMYTHTHVYAHMWPHTHTHVDVHRAHARSTQPGLSFCPGPGAEPHTPRPLGPSVFAHGPPRVPKHVLLELTPMEDTRARPLPRGAPRLAMGSHTDTWKTRRSPGVEVPFWVFPPPTCSSNSVPSTPSSPGQPQSPSEAPPTSHCPGEAALPDTHV